MMENETIQPINPPGTAILFKLLIGLVIGLIFSAVVFLSIMLLGSSVDIFVKSNGVNSSPLVWLSFMGIALLISIVGTLIIAVIYNVLWPEDYYDIKLMSSGILLSNLLLFLVFLLFYIYAGVVLHDATVFVVYGFHLSFSIFISFTMIDVMKNPNYAPVYIIGNSFGFIIALLIFFVIYQGVYSTTAGNDIKNILFYPPILSFSIIPFVATIWEKLYYKFYEMGNDFLYVPSLTEVMVDEEDVDDVNVDI